MTDEDALGVCAHNVLQTTPQLAMRRALSIILSVPRNRQVLGFNHGGGQGSKRETLLRHSWPFAVNCFVYIAGDESAKLRPLLFGEATIEVNSGSKCAGLCGDRELGSVEVTPHVYGDKT